MVAKILLVEDDLELTEMLKTLLEAQRYTVECLGNGLDAIDCLRTFEYDLIILDWNLPGCAGVDVCCKARELSVNTPILMLTGKSEIDDRVEGLDRGADDYQTKPFKSQELLARIRSLMRRLPVFASKVMKVGELVVEPDTHKVSFHGQEIKLFPKEYDLLEYFMRHPGQVFSQEDLLNRVWTSEADTASSSIRTHVYRLRGKLSLAGHECPIKTVHGVGYKLDPETSNS